MKRNPISFIAILFILLVLLALRIYTLPDSYRVFQWDSLGYYLYLPSHYIYHDMTHLSFYPAMLAKYHFPGPFYQASLKPNGNYVFFYEIGISYLETPFFFIGHWLAGALQYPQDGFSKPYQYSICAGMFFYIGLGLFLLRTILLRYFNDVITTWTLLLTALATNYPEYTAVEAGLTHGYLFTLLCMLLLFTIWWHDKPTMVRAALIGFIIGLIAVTRITDTVMLFIPLLWNTQTKELRKAKWAFVKQHPSHLIALAVALAIPIIPQLIYWKYATGNWIYTLGSRWDFLSPHFRVLIGWEKGWFIYTPVTVLMVAGLFFMTKAEFKRSIITYFLLNVWIITAWHEWHYGGYSARALTQSLAAMSLPLGALLERLSKVLWRRVVFIPLSLYLCYVNFFQLWQYSKTIIPFGDMNHLYYAAIYLNSSPSQIDMSMLDTDERMENESNDYLDQIVSDDNHIFHLNGTNDTIQYLYTDPMFRLSSPNLGRQYTIQWVRLSASVKSEWGAYDTYLVTEITNGDSIIKKRSVRMQNAICSDTGWNNIRYFFKIPPYLPKWQIKVFCTTKAKENIDIKDFELRGFDVH